MVRYLFLELETLMSPGRITVGLSLGVVLLVPLQLGDVGLQRWWQALHSLLDASMSLQVGAASRQPHDSWICVV